MFGNSGRHVQSEAEETNGGRGCRGNPDPTALSEYLLVNLRVHPDVDEGCCKERGGSSRNHEEDEDEEDSWEEEEEEDAHDKWSRILTPSMDFATQHRTREGRDGYGLGPGTIDCDSLLRGATEDAVRLGRLDHGRQLCTRVFVSAPNLAKRRPDPLLESRIVPGVDTSDTRRCYRIGEESYDRFDPGVCQVPVDHIVPPWTAGGASSRDIARSRPFQHAVARLQCRAVGAVGAPDLTALYASAPTPPPAPTPASCARKDAEHALRRKAAAKAKAEADAEAAKAEKAATRRAERAWKKLEALAAGRSMAACSS